MKILFRCLPVVLVLISLQSCNGQKYPSFEEATKNNDRYKVFETVVSFLPTNQPDSEYLTAIKELDSLANILADSAKTDIYYYKAVFFRRLGMFESARYNINNSIKLDPRNFHSWFEKGNVNDWVKNIDSANMCYRKSLELLEDYITHSKHIGATEHRYKLLLYLLLDEKDMAWPYYQYICRSKILKNTIQITEYEVRNFNRMEYLKKWF